MFPCGRTRERKTNMQLPIRIKKTGQTINVDTLAMVGNNPAFAVQLEAVLAHKPVMYGLTQSVIDAHATLTLAGDGVEKVMAAAQKKLAAILTGTVKVRGTTVTHADPIMHEAMKLANKWWKGKGDGGQNAAIGKIRAKGGRFDDMEDKAIVEVILAAYCADESTQEKAEAIVAANAMKVDDDFDLDEIML